MRVQFSLRRPAAVDRSVHAIRTLASNGHHVGVSVSGPKSASTADRLATAAIDHTVLTAGTAGFGPVDSLLSPVDSLLEAIRLCRYAGRFRPDVIVGASPVVRLTARLTGARVVPLDSPGDGSQPTAGSPTVWGAAARYHPDWVSPDAEIRRRHGVDEAQSYAIALFTAKASPYNAPQAGLSRRTKQQLVASLSEAGRVYVSNTDDPHPALSASRITVPTHQTPELARGASLLVTDAARQAVIAGLCGTPTVYAHTSENTAIPESVDELAAQKLIRVAVGDSETQSTLEELVADSQREAIWDRRATRFFRATGDPTSALLEAILGPSSRSQSAMRSITTTDSLDADPADRSL